MAEDPDQQSRIPQQHGQAGAAAFGQTTGPLFGSSSGFQGQGPIRPVTQFSTPLVQKPQQPVQPAPTDPALDLRQQQELASLFPSSSFPTSSFPSQNAYSMAPHAAPATTSFPAEWPNTDPFGLPAPPSGAFPPTSAPGPAPGASAPFPSTAAPSAFTTSTPMAGNPAYPGSSAGAFTFPPSSSPSSSASSPFSSTSGATSFPSFSPSSAVPSFPSAPDTSLFASTSGAASLSATFPSATSFPSYGAAAPSTSPQSQMGAFGSQAGAFPAAQPGIGMGPPPPPVPQIPQRQGPPSTLSSSLPSVTPSPSSAPPGSQRAKPTEKSLSLYVEEFMQGMRVLPPNLQQLDGLQPNLGNLRILASLSAWKRVSVLAAQALAEYKEHGSPLDEEYMQMKVLHLVSLSKQRRYEEMSKELTAMGDLDSKQYLYETYPERYPGRTGSLLPMAVRLLAAEVHQRLGNPKETQDQLSILLNRLEQEAPQSGNPSFFSSLSPQLSPLQQGAAPASPRGRAGSFGSLGLAEGEAEMWVQRVKYAIVNSFVHEKKYDSALALLDLMMEEMKKKHHKDLFATSSVACQIGLLYLQIGHTQAAEEAFQEAEKSRAEDGQSALTTLNRGLIAFARNEFRTALECFEYTFNNLIAAESDLFTGSTVDVELMSAAANNFAICSLYCCDVKRAVATLEDAIRRDPRKHLQEMLVFNLCTLYDLACDNATSGRKKRVLQQVASRFSLDHIDNACFRI